MDPDGPVRVKWRKSRYCDGGSCVEVGQAGCGLIAVRDSGNPDGPPLVFSSSNWESFIRRAAVPRAGSPARSPQPGSGPARALG